MITFKLVNITGDNMSKGDKAKELFTQGYNCCQAVFGAFAENLGLDFETAVKISSGFGGGMGRLREVCGAVSGMFMVYSYKNGYSNPTASDKKKELYNAIQMLAEEFKNENGSIICRELLGLNIKGADTPDPSERTQAYYKKRPCGELVKIAADIVEKYL